MRLGYAVVLAASFAAPAIAQQVIIQGPQPGQARHAAREAGIERHEARGDVNAARREEREAWRDLSHGNFGAAMGEERAAQRDIQGARREQNEARQDVNRARRDEDWRIRIER